MALDKAIDSIKLNSDLTSVADAIRTKTSSPGKLQFPQGFVSAINSISTGGGGVPAADKDSGTLMFDSVTKTVTIPTTKKRNTLVISCFPAQESQFKGQQVAAYFSNPLWYAKNTAVNTFGTIKLNGGDAGNQLYGSDQIALFTDSTITFTLAPGGFAPKVKYNWEAW